MKTTSARKQAQINKVNKKHPPQPKPWGDIRFHYQKLQKIYETGEGSHKYTEAVRENFFEKMVTLNMVSNRSDLFKFKSLGFHKLKKGKLKGKYAVWLTGNWRLILAIEEDELSEYLLIIEIIDYHH